MRMHCVVVFDPRVDQGERFRGVCDWADTDVVALEGFDKGLGHAVALWAFDRGEARRQIERQGSARSGAGKKTDVAVALAAARRYPVKTIAETLGAARSNLIE